MKLREVRSAAASLASHPVTFLLAINIACAALGLAQFAFVLAVLKPADFAVVGVLAAIGGVVTGLFDVKLADLTTKLFFGTPKAEREGRAGLLSASLALHFAVGAMIGGIVVVVGITLGSRLLEQQLAVWWVSAMALRMTVGYPVNALTAFLRLVGDFSGSGWLRLVSQAMVTAVTFIALSRSPDLDGYFLAANVSAALTLALAIGWVSRGIARSLGVSILGWPKRVHVGSLLSARSFLAGGSLTGLAKLLSRSCDTLLMAALTNDATTGIYRVARQAFDNLSGLADAVHQFYTPTIVDCISRKDFPAFRKHRRRLMAIGMLTAGAAIAGSLLVLRPLADAHYPHYVAALPAFEVMTGLFVVTLGIHGWLWPTLVASGRIGWFGIFGIVGAFLQLGTLVVLGVNCRLLAITAAKAIWIMAIVNYGPLLFFWWRFRQGWER